MSPCTCVKRYSECQGISLVVFRVQQVHCHAVLGSLSRRKWTASAKFLFSWDRSKIRVTLGSGSPCTWSHCGEHSNVLLKAQTLVLTSTRMRKHTRVTLSYHNFACFFHWKKIEKQSFSHCSFHSFFTERKRKKSFELFFSIFHWGKVKKRLFSPFFHQRRVKKSFFLPFLHCFFVLLCCGHSCADPVNLREEIACLTKEQSVFLTRKFNSDPLVIPDIFFTRWKKKSFRSDSRTSEICRWVNFAKFSSNIWSLFSYVVSVWALSGFPVWASHKCLSRPSRSGARARTRTRAVAAAAAAAAAATARTTTVSPAPMSASATAADNWNDDDACKTRSHPHKNLHSVNLRTSRNHFSMQNAHISPYFTTFFCFLGSWMFAE